MGEAQIFGRQAEDSVAEHYRARGANILAQRHRTPYGEIDLVLEHCQSLVFVEVKARHSLSIAKETISSRQWKRLEFAATDYMVNMAEGKYSVIRFDAAFVDKRGRIDIIKNAHSFDEW